MESESRIVETTAIVELPNEIKLYDDDLFPVVDEHKLVGVGVPLTNTRTDTTCTFKLYVDYRSDKGFEICTKAKNIDVVPCYSDGDHDYGDLRELALLYAR